MRYRIPYTKPLVGYQKPEVTSSPILAKLGWSRAVIMNPLIATQPAGGSVPPGPAIAAPNNWMIFDTIANKVQYLSGYTLPPKVREQAQAAMDVGSRVAQSSNFVPAVPAGVKPSLPQPSSAVIDSQRQEQSIINNAVQQPSTTSSNQKVLPTPDLNIIPAGALSPAQNVPIPSGPPAYTEGCVNCGSKSQQPTGTQITPISFGDKVKAILDRQLISVPSSTNSERGFKLIDTRSGWARS
ncbi:MAG: hypothetical protein QXZ36_03655 [Thermoproteota archaeon]